MPLSLLINLDQDATKTISTLGPRLNKTPNEVIHLALSLLSQVYSTSEDPVSVTNSKGDTFPL